jgi:hypothetical protein
VQFSGRRRKQADFALPEGVIDDSMPRSLPEAVRKSGSWAGEWTNPRSNVKFTWEKAGNRSLAGFWGAQRVFASKPTDAPQRATGRFLCPICEEG